MRPNRTTLCTCLTCGTEFRVNNYRIEHGGGKYCSKECRGRAMRNRVSLACATCGTPMDRKASAERGVRSYCSNPCRYARNPREIALSDDGQTALIPLFDQNGGLQEHAIIDAADAEWASQWPWFLNAKGYVTHNPGVLLHRELLGLTPGDGMFGDHINLNPLDNRRENLRPATPSESPQNVPARPGSSEHRGVAWNARRGLWQAYVHLGWKRVYSAFFETEQEAADAARVARAQLLPFTTN